MLKIKRFNPFFRQCITALHQSLTTRITSLSHPHVRFCFILSLGIAVFYGLLSMQQAFSGEYVIQDDARQHVFWMQRFITPDLFPEDLIADYLQSLAPWGYTIFYKSLAFLGINPLIASKVLPLILALITTVYCFGVSLQFLPIPAVGLITTLILNQGLWIEDDLVSATPRAFVYPIFFAFLYYLLGKSLFPLLITIALSGLFYPQITLLFLAILTLRLFEKRNNKILLSPLIFNRLAWLTGGFIAVFVLLPYKLNTTEFGEMITVSQAKLRPEFYPLDGLFGRAFFFHENPFIYWLVAPQTGLLFIGLVTPLALFGFALPFLLKQTQRFPLTQQISSEVKILGQVLLASLALYFLAHAVLFQLYFPTRYTYHSFKIVLILAAGLAVTLILETQLRTLIQLMENGFTRYQLMLSGLTLCLGILLVTIPFLPGVTLPNQLYRTGKEPLIYEFLQKQPKETLVATLSEEADFIPTLAQRSTLIALEYDYPYHSRYYTQFQQRLLDLVNAQYSSDLREVQDFIRKYGVDFWLIDGESTFKADYISTRVLIRQVELVKPIVEKIEQGQVFVLSTLVEGCAVVKSEHRQLLDAQCILQQGQNKA
ncbi:MAG: hypothetical protein WAN66_15690 [Limnoraphis robusta]|uniref:Glycosyltransferase RgtA/B/C/D-like domain-containing protein n=1 Tax=Limnoraphis robusta CS-951 TaxID=1637645 RepID=A0A0F5Y6Z2_9CYAN|nr:hypothetical protein [Limnoraphis robusta]KKD34619.1 hypothetical protein WN50_29870 [Limnoraphis robusta CS-951]